MEVGSGGGIRTLILRQLHLAPLQAGTGSGDRFFLSTWDCDPQDDPPAEFTQTPELGPPRAHPQHRRFWVSPGGGQGQRLLRQSHISAARAASCVHRQGPSAGWSIVTRAPLGAPFWLNSYFPFVTSRNHRRVCPSAVL